MRAALTLFFLLLLSIALGVQFHRDPGYLLLSINHWTLEAPLWLGILFIILSFFILHYFLLLSAKIFNIPSRLGRWTHKHRIQKAQEKTQKGLIEFSEGHWAKAQYHLIKALPNSDSPLLNYLTAARAAQELGNSKSRDNYLREAQQSMPNAKIAVKLTQAQLQMKTKQWEQALATLKHLQDIVPQHPYVLKLLLCLYKEINDWQQIIVLLPSLKKNQVISDSEFKTLEHEVYLAYMMTLLKNKNIKGLHDAVNNLPKSLRFNPDLMEVYCNMLLECHLDNQAEPILRHCLKKGFNHRLISLYGQLNSDNKELSFAESLLDKHSDSADLYLCLGRLSAKISLLGKAKDYLQQSMQIKQTPEAYAELGKLFEALKDKTKAYEAYRKGLLLATQTIAES